MAENSTDKIFRREDLEKKFKDGAIPQEADFKDLIYSTINKQDDGFSKTDANGFEIRINKPKYQRFISLFKDANDPNIFFTLEKDGDASAVILSPGNVNDAENNPEKHDHEKAHLQENSFFFDTRGNMGIGKKAEENLKLEVDGFVGMKGRTGTYNTNPVHQEVPADGTWYDITPELDYCNGFEILARAGLIGTRKRKFALLHAIAMATFGPSKGHIRKTSAHYGFFWNKLNLRWTGSIHKYKLQIKSNSNYGNNAQIFIRISQLWSDETFLNKQFYKKD